MAAIYAEKVCDICSIQITPQNVHRIYLSGFVLAAKWRDDFYFSNEFYSLVGGVSLPEMNRLEQHILCTLDWDFDIPVNEYNAAVVKYIAMHEARLLSISPEFDPRTSAQMHDARSSASSWASYSDAISGTTSPTGTSSPTDHDVENPPCDGAVTIPISPVNSAEGAGLPMHPMPDGPRKRCWRRVTSWCQRNPCRRDHEELEIVI